MRGAVLHGPGDVRVEDRAEPRIEQPTDAVIRLAATCVCGSDLWPYRGIEAVNGPSPMGHEYVGIVEQVGSEVRSIKPGQFVVGSFWASDNTCEICRAGYQNRCLHAELMGTIGTQAELARVPLADGTLVATPDIPSDDLVRACSLPLTSSARAGSAPSPPMSSQERSSPSWGTGRSGCSPFWPPGGLAPNELSP
jgi:threonine dehydrogenase-like Zn-dependent dehydrogenase